MNVAHLLIEDDKRLALQMQAQSIAKEFSYIVDSEDLRQGFLVWALEHPQRIQRCFYQDANGAEVFSWSRFRREAGGVMAGIARREKARAIGYQPEDEFFYTRTKVQDLLPFVWLDRSYMQDKPTTDKVSTADDPAKGGDRSAEIMDVRAAYEKVVQPRPEWDRVLLWIYGLGLTQDEVAEAESVSQQAVSKRHDRALDAVLFKLNGTEPNEEYRLPPQGRRAVSNAAAAALRERQEGGQ